MSINQTIRTIGVDKLRIEATCKVTQQPYFVDVTWASWKKWQGGATIQSAMPELDDEQREFLITGITPAEWKRAFGEGE